ncbi:hypothetical protein J4463_01040 [Candidatus Pacearchaeota archaeon]|nr:hypothetical protein [Candidatus Pacearchaeota archaeon]
MATLDIIKIMKQQGYSNSDVIRSLQEKGISPRDINEAMAQSSIKQAVGDNSKEYEEDSMITEGMETSIMTPKQQSNFQQTEFEQQGQQEQYGQQTIPQEQYPPQQEQYEQYTAQPQQQAYPPQQMPQQQEPQYWNQQPEQYAPQTIPQTAEYGQYEQNNGQYGTEYGAGYSQASTETISEVANQLIEEKTSKMSKSVKDVSEFKIMASAQLEKLNSRLEKIESIIDSLQASLIRKASEQEQNIGDIKTEMRQMQDGFRKVINPLIDGAREVQTKSTRRK